MFYEYHQNNSGGRFTSGYGLASIVIIEADSSEEADFIAESIGIYFDGCMDGRDCDCCGDRWYPQANGWSGVEGDEVPTIYGQDVSDGVYSDKYGIGWTDPYGYVHYKDGTVQEITYRKENDNE